MITLTVIAFIEARAATRRRVQGARAADPQHASAPRGRVRGRREAERPGAQAPQLRVAGPATRC